jgi:predicted nucleotidyltransferase
VTIRPQGRRRQIVDPVTAEEALLFAERLARGCAQVLRDRVAAMILHGSLTLGDYTPGRSDIDLLVVAERAGEIAALKGLAVRERAHAPARVDLRFVTRKVAAAPTPSPPMELYIVMDPASGIEVETNHAGERDLVVELSMCRADGISLLGPPPSSLIGEVPDEWVLAVGDAQLADWQAIGDDPVHAELTVLTALRRDPTLQAVHEALHRRRTDPTFAIAAEPVRELLAMVRSRLRAARA